MVNEKKFIFHVFDWLLLVRRIESNKGFFNYVSSFMPVVYGLSAFPRAPKFVRNTLQFTLDMRMGDLYIFEKYTIVRI